MDVTGIERGDSVTKPKEPQFEIILKRRTEQGDPVIQPAYVSKTMYHHILGVIRAGTIPVESDNEEEIKALRKEVQEMKTKLASVRRAGKGV